MKNILAILKIDPGTLEKEFVPLLPLATPINTATPTATSTPTATQTPTATATISMAPSATATKMPTEKAKATPTVEEAISGTPMPTPTMTATTGTGGMSNILLGIMIGIAAVIVILALWPKIKTWLHQKTA